MLNKSDIYYENIINYFSDPGARTKGPLSAKLIQKMEMVLLRGNKKQKSAISKIFTCCVFDGDVAGYSINTALSLLATHLKANKETMPIYIYNRIISSLDRINQEQALSYLLLSFDLHQYDAIWDIGYVLIAGAGETYVKNAEAYFDAIYRLLLDSLKSSDKKFIAIIFHLLRHIEMYKTDIFEEGISLLENAMLSEDWMPKHQNMIQNLVLNHAILQSGTTIVEINDRLQLIDSAELKENLHSSTPGLQ